VACPQPLRLVLPPGSWWVNHTPRKNSGQKYCPGSSWLVCSTWVDWPRSSSPYQPQKQADTAAIAELSASATAAAEADASKIIDLTNDYNQALKQNGDAQAELDLTKGELEATRNFIVDKDAELARVNLTNISYKFLVDVSSARIALEKQDTASARQAINYAKADLEALKTANVTADVLSGFAEKLNEASSNLTPTGLVKSRSALDSLYSNLLLFIDNLP